MSLAARRPRKRRSVFWTPTDRPPQRPPCHGRIPSQRQQPADLTRLMQDRPDHTAHINRPICRQRHHRHSRQSAPRRITHRPQHRERHAVRMRHFRDNTGLHIDRVAPGSLVQRPLGLDRSHHRVRPVHHMRREPTQTCSECRIHRESAALRHHLLRHQHRSGAQPRRQACPPIRSSAAPTRHPQRAAPPRVAPPPRCRRQSPWARPAAARSVPHSPCRPRPRGNANPERKIPPVPAS